MLSSCSQLLRIGSTHSQAASALIGRDGLQWREEALPED
jgi:hypothetical protein